MPDPIAAIERQYGFVLPELYHRLYRDGMLNWGDSQPNWYANVFPHLRKKPPMLLFALDFELYAPETVPARQPAQDWGTAYQFVPLGHTGRGDLYAFCPTLTTNGETPITLSYRDSNETTALAPSLEAFIFREMLARATFFDECDLTGYADFEALRVDWQRAVQSMTPYLRPAWAARLAEVYARPLRLETVVLPRRQYTVETLLPDAEFEEILRREMPFEHLNASFEHFPR